MPKHRLTYLAAPFSDPDPCIQQFRFREVSRCTAFLMHRGLCVFSPVTHSAHLLHFGCPNTWSFWRKQDEAVLERASELLILTLDGWRNSVGVNAEIAIAQELGIPIHGVIQHGHEFELTDFIDGEIVRRGEAEEGEV